MPPSITIKPQYSQKIRLAEVADFGGGAQSGAHVIVSVDKSQGGKRKTAMNIGVIIAAAVFCRLLSFIRVMTNDPAHRPGAEDVRLQWQCSRRVRCSRLG